MIIAVDGPAASGKGTLARRLAAHFGFAYLETGLLYRAVARRVLDAKGDPADPIAAERAAHAFDFASLQDLAWRQALTEDVVSDAASKVAAIPGVRAALLDLQRDFVRRPPGGEPGVVLDGRDTGTVISPEADVKLFVNASPEIRAERRHKELRERGVDSIYARVLEDLKARDARDTARAAAPLKPAVDAIVLDTSALDADQVFAAAIAIVERKSGKRARR
jgi:cytidylate kinase